MRRRLRSANTSNVFTGNRIAWQLYNYTGIYDTLQNNKHHLQLHHPTTQARITEGTYLKSLDWTVCTPIGSKSRATMLVTPS
jgi:hypothetical protein